ncbi:MAG: NAD(P)-dependent dehydrogenase (short-subunit alcohol dehydrogenase family) [Candidatus Pseudothioglobus sp.]|jgi:NAD(P)-dependent dehydrogenase (short-subunit alcohol dehydrogenase family)|tara:strand:- start:607 stop:1515 length:909 start_codon:yes stop_codon:yes gene_type:complete
MKKENWNESDIPDQTRKVFIVTGASSGLGKETVIELARKNATVVIAARDLNASESVKSEILNINKDANVDVQELDLASLHSIQKFSKVVNKKYKKIDVLINNAGVMACPHSKTEDGFEIQIGTNHLGHFALTGLLLSTLKNTKNSRIVNISSIAHKSGNIDFNDLNWEKRKYKTWGAYGDSKLANLYFTYELSRKLGQNNGNPKVLAAHPGYSDTSLQRYSGFFKVLNKIIAQKSSIGALAGIRAAIDPIAQSDDYYGSPSLGEMRGHPVLLKSNELSYNKENAEKLWKLSEELTGVKFNID